MVILRSQNKITDFLMILAWACPFKHFRAFIGPNIPGIGVTDRRCHFANDITAITSSCIFPAARLYLCDLGGSEPCVDRIVSFPKAQLTNRINSVGPSRCWARYCLWFLPLYVQRLSHISVTIHSFLLTNSFSETKSTGDANTRFNCGPASETVDQLLPNIVSTICD